MNIDIPEVKGRMAKLGYNCTSFSNALQISRNTLNSYFLHPEKIPYSVIVKMAELLCDSTEDAGKVFFAA